MNDSIPPDLADLKAQFDSWRQTRTSRAPIPDHLRQAARSLLDRYPAATICRTLRLNPRSLKPSSTANSAVASDTASSGQAFFNLSHSAQRLSSSPPAHSTNSCRLMLERADGSRLTLSLPELDLLSISTVCANFLANQ